MVIWKCSVSSALNIKTAADFKLTLWTLQKCKFITTVKLKFDGSCVFSHLFGSLSLSFCLIPFMVYVFGSFILRSVFVLPVSSLRQFPGSNVYQFFVSFLLSLCHHFSFLLSFPDLAPPTITWALLSFPRCFVISPLLAFLYLLCPVHSLSVCLCPPSNFHVCFLVFCSSDYFSTLLYFSILVLCCLVSYMYIIFFSLILVPWVLFLHFVFNLCTGTKKDKVNVFKVAVIELAFRICQFLALMTRNVCHKVILKCC